MTSQLLTTTAQPVAPKPVTPKPSRKKRYWRGLALGLTVFILCNLLVVLLEPYFLSVVAYQSSQTVTKLSLYQQGPRPDVLFMGSSRVENGFDPAVVEQAVANQTGVKPRMLNIGMPSAGLALNYLVLKNMIQSGKKPAVIVYGLAELELDTPVPDQNYYQKILKDVPYSDVLFRLDDIGRYGGDSLDEKATFAFNQLIPVFRDQKLIKQALDIQFNPFSDYHDKYQKKTIDTPDGFAPFEAPLEQPEQGQHAQVYKEPLGKMQILPEDLALLRDFLKLAKDKGIKVILVNMPVTSQHVSFWKPDSLKQYLDVLQTVAREYEMPLLDMYQNAEKYIPLTGFYDSNHLTRQGANILSQIIGQGYLANYFKAADYNSPDFYRASLSNLNLRVRMPTSYLTTGTVSFTNLSQGYWPTVGNKSIRLSYHWLKNDGSIYDFEGVRTYLNYSPLPGEPQTIQFNLKTPKEPGTYILQLSFVLEYVTWFEAKGSPTLRQTVTIEAGK